MKKISLPYCILSIIFMIYQPSQVNALSLTPYFGGYRFEGNSNVGDTLLTGLGADFQLTDNFAADFIYLKGDADLNYLNINTLRCMTLESIDTHIFHVSGRYHLFTKSNVTPYVTTGLGIFSMDTDYAEMFRDHPDRHYLFQFHYGGGFKYYLTQSLSLRGDLRHMISFENMDNDLVATIGVSYTFGTPAKKVPAQKGHLKKHEETVLPGTKDHATRKSEVHGTSDSDRNIQAKSETTTQDHIKPKEKVHDVQINQEPAHQEKLETKKPIKTKKQIVSKPVQQVATGSKTNTDRMASHKGYHKMQPKTLVSKQSDRELQMAYVDTDADGILDHVDKCPATPRNVRVNIFGCAPDHDRDGVIDVLDQCPDTPAKTKVDKMGCRITVIKKPQKHVVNLPEKRQTWRTTIQFDYKSAQIKSVYHANLLSITQWMKKISDPVIIINSHTDNIGSQIYNINLSDKRADSLKKYLHEQFQTPEHLIKTFSFGETQPVADNATEEGRQKNRRAEIVVTDNKH